MEPAKIRFRQIWIWDFLLQMYWIHVQMQICHAITAVAEWLACWTQAQKDPGSNCSRDAFG